jgi:hypothetical protein
MVEAKWTLEQFGSAVAERPSRSAGPDPAVARPWLGHLGKIEFSRNDPKLGTRSLNGNPARMVEGKWTLE